jgi:ParB-like chromosome segregation protein Spo0J
MDTSSRPELSIVYRSIDALVVNPNNSRTHSKRQIRQIAESIKTFGFTNPILVTGEDVIIAGHGRVAAAKLLGIASVPTIRMENLTDGRTG